MRNRSRPIRLTRAGPGCNILFTNFGTEPPVLKVYFAHAAPPVPPRAPRHPLSQVRPSAARGSAPAPPPPPRVPDGGRVVTAGYDDKTARIWLRRRPEWWWGVFYLTEFWLTVFFAALFAWSVWRDRKAFAPRSAGAAEQNGDMYARR